MVTRPSGNPREGSTSRTGIGPPAGGRPSRRPADGGPRVRGSRSAPGPGPTGAPASRRKPPWQVRLAVEAARTRQDLVELRGALRDLVDGLPWLHEGVPDPAVVEISASVGLTSGDLVFMGAVTGAPVTLVGIPAPLWHNPARRRDIARLRRRARLAGCRVLVVPWCAAVREPRLGNAVKVASAARGRSRGGSRAAIPGPVSTGRVLARPRPAAVAGYEGAWDAVGTPVGPDAPRPVPGRPAGRATFPRAFPRGACRPSRFGARTP